MTEKSTTIPQHLVKNSSNIHGLSYDPAGKRLTVHFKNGGIYHHHGVKPDEFADLKGAESVGKHYHANIRGRYETTKVEPEPKEGE